MWKSASLVNFNKVSEQDKLERWYEAYTQLKSNNFRHKLDEMQPCWSQNTCNQKLPLDMNLNYIVDAKGRTIIPKYHAAIYLNFEETSSIPLVEKTIVQEIILDTI